MIEEMEEVEERKVCLTYDYDELEEMVASPVVTCGKCGVKAHDAAYVCEAGIHSDIL